MARGQAQRAVITTDDLTDSADSDVLDMTESGQTPFERMQMLQVVDREFPYEEMPDVMINKDGEAVEFINAGRSAAYEAFMQEPIVIVINETDDPRASPTVFCGSNGDTKWVPRGIKVRLRRYHVEVLAQSSERTFKTPKVNTSEENDNERPAKQKNTQSYSFNVLSDPNPIGKKWFERVTRQGRQQNAR